MVGVVGVVGVVGAALGSVVVRLGCGSDSFGVTDSKSAM